VTGLLVKLRIRYSKLGKVRWTSQRDVARIWERGLRRAGLPVAYSKGFSPRPLISFGLGLPTGCESVAEYLDVVLEGRPVGEASADEAWADGMALGLSSLLPAGFDVLSLAWIDPASRSLQESVTCCRWEVEVLPFGDESLESRLERLLEAPSVPVSRERKGREEVVDLGPAIESLVSLGPSDRPGCFGSGTTVLSAELATRPTNVRPHELAAALGAELRSAIRTHQWIDHDGTRVEPLALEVASSAVEWASLS